MSSPLPRKPDSRQVVGSPRAEYELVGVVIPDEDDQVSCRHCGQGIVKHDDHWYAIRSRWPNLRHCHYAAHDGRTSMPHEPPC